MNFKEIYKGLLEAQEKSIKQNAEVLAALKKANTCDLVAELETREGVETTIAEPYQDVQVKANGPAIVLVVID